MTQKIIFAVVLLAGAIVALAVTLFRRLPPPPPVEQTAVAVRHPEFERLESKWGHPRYSWQYEELFVRDFFQDRREGFFVDVGAYDYRKYSNTYYLEKHLNWHGLAIDAQEEFGAGFRQHRPQTKFFVYFVTDETGGMADFFVDEVDDAQATGNKPLSDSRARLPALREIPMITLNDLLDREGVKKIDFLTMDIESGEPAALRGFDIGRFDPAFVCIEVYPPVADVLRDYFSKNAYVRVDTWSDLDRYNDYYATAESYER